LLSAIPPSRDPVRDIKPHTGSLGGEDEVLPYGWEEDLVTEMGIRMSSELWYLDYLAYVECHESHFLTYHEDLYERDPSDRDPLTSEFYFRDMEDRYILSYSPLAYREWLMSRTGSREGHEYQSPDSHPVMESLLSWVESGIQKRLLEAQDDDSKRELIAMFPSRELFHRLKEKDPRWKISPIRDPVGKKDLLIILDQYKMETNKNFLCDYFSLSSLTGSRTGEWEDSEANNP
jgi:hypothetical protein